MKKAIYDFATWVSRLVEHPFTLIFMAVLVIIWIIVGFFVKFSVGWNFAGNQPMTVITFLMTFILAISQAGFSAALMIKLGEVIKSLPEADNRVLDIDAYTPEELKQIVDQYAKLAKDIDGKVLEENNEKV